MRADCKRPLMFVAAYRRLMSLMVFNKRGTEIAARIMIMATTINNSIREKPRPLFCFVVCSIYGTRMPLSFAQVCPGGSFIVGLGGTRVKAPRYIVPGNERHPRAGYAAMLRFDRGQSYSRVTSVRSSGGRGAW